MAIVEVEGKIRCGRLRIVRLLTLYDVHVDELFIHRRDDGNLAFFPGNMHLRREGMMAPHPACVLTAESPAKGIIALSHADGVC